MLLGGLKKWLYLEIFCNNKGLITIITTKIGSYKTGVFKYSEEPLNWLHLTYKIKLNFYVTFFI